MLEEQGLAKQVISHLNIECDELDLTEWNELLDKMHRINGKVRIALVGKYIELKDAYLSVTESLYHAGIENGVDVEIKWIQAEDLEDDNCKDYLDDVEGILVPGGFGTRGIEGKICAIKYARENKIPFFGIALGMQLAVIEYARNILGLAGAHGTEWDPDTEFPVIDLMPEQRDAELLNGKMRLGLYPCKIAEDTLAMDIYQDEIDWMNQVLAQYSDRKAIIALHRYANVKMADNLLDYTGKLLKENVVAQNPNVIAVLNAARFISEHA